MHELKKRHLRRSLAWFELRFSHHAARLGVRGDDTWPFWVGNWCKAFHTWMHQILKSIFVYVQPPMVNRFSTAMTEPTGLSFIYKSLILRANNCSFFKIFLYHRIISESLGCSLKLRIKWTYTIFSCTRVKALPFYNSTKKKKKGLALLPSPSPLKAKRFVCAEG